MFPHLGSIADEMCIIRSMKTEAINHDPAHTFMNTGSTISGRPAAGSWTLYGLGSENQDLPGFVVLTSTGRGGQMQPISSRMWHSGFLPSRYQGVKFQSRGDAVYYLSNPPGVTPQRQHETIDTIDAINRLRQETVDDPEIATRIAQYELAFRMQTSVPELMDLTTEPKHVLEMYGTTGNDGSFAANCLLARRLAERGVRFIQVYHRDWDMHGDLKRDMPINAKETDQASAALIKDLKQRGLLEDTLVIWGGEFGRTPMNQGTRPRSPHQGFFPLDGRRRHQAGHYLRRDRRTGLQRREGRGRGPRPARHDALSVGHRPPADDLPLSGPRLPPDRRGGEGGEGDFGIIKSRLP